ncbi:MAG: 50S ribosomal protein L11 methyltransferase [Actinomycetota bacterium]|nr:50S ribosomal protein L11 methyltransferase [Actinomycetota bacterium]
MDNGIDQLKQAQRAAWSAGDYRPIGQLLETAAEELVARADVRAGHRVIDIGVGSGGVAIAAARRGASVVGIDLTPA